MDICFCCSNIMHTHPSCCGEQNLIEENNSYIVCTSCGTVVSDSFYVEEDNKPNYYPKFYNFGSLPYKRTTHFKKILNCWTGQANSDFKDEILDILKSEQATENNVNKILGKYKLYKEYVHLEQYKRILNPEYKPIHLSCEDFKMLIILFGKCESNYVTKFPHRKTFLRFKQILKVLLRDYLKNDIHERIPDLNGKSKKNFYKIWNEIKP